MSETVEITKAAHIISERQKKGALSAIKKKPKLPKNFLVKNEIEFWPCLDENQTGEFEQVLERLTSQPEALKQISIGLESTLRHVKRNEVNLLVIADELSPRWFAKHLIAMAMHKNQRIKVVIVKNLKEITKSSLKIPSIIFGVKSSAFDEFYSKQIKTHPELTKHFISIQPSIDVSKKRKKSKESPTVQNAVTLLKKTSSSRSFIPMDTEEAQETQPNLAQNSSGFISFSKHNENSSKFHTNSPLTPYRPIKIKKVIGNPKRNLLK